LDLAVAYGRVAPIAMRQVTAELLAGTGGGILGTLAGHPFDTAKVRLQAMPAMQAASLSTCLRRTINEEGLLALYKGVLSPVAMCGLLNAIIFATERSVARLLAPLDMPTGTVSFFSGCCGGMAQTPVLCVMDAAKCNMQVNGGRHYAESSYFETFRRRVRALGLQKALFPGLCVTIVREVPSYGVYFLVYDSVKAWLEASLPQAVATLLAGGSAGVISLAPFHPLDVVKSRLQVSSDPSHTAWGLLKAGCAVEGLASRRSSSSPLYNPSQKDIPPQRCHFLRL